jgi:hypothetical protein
VHGGFFVLIIIRKGIKMAIIRGEQELHWNRELFMFNDLVGISHFSSELEGEHQRSITITNYFQSMLSNIYSEKLLRKGKNPTYFEKYMHFFGTLCLYESLGLKDMVFESIIKKIRIPPSSYIGDLTKMVDKFDRSDEKISTSISDILKYYYKNSNAIRCVYELYYSGSAINQSNNNHTISLALKHQCMDMIKNNFSSKFLKIEKTSDNESIRIHPYPEAMILLGKVKFEIYKYSTFAEINRLALCFGIYVCADMIACDLVDLTDKEVCNAIESLKKLYLIKDAIA